MKEKEIEFVYNKFHRKVVVDSESGKETDDVSDGTNSQEQSVKIEHVDGVNCRFDQPVEVAESLRPTQKS